MDRIKGALMNASSLPVKSALALPLQAAWLSLKYWQGQETSITSLQRLGLSYDSRTPGPLIWFHASTLGECAVALPVLFRCLLEYNEKVAVMLTTASVEAYNMLRSSLPARVIVQMMPLDNAVCVSLFMRRWRPTVGILVESPFSPQLVLVAAAFHVRLALINAHIEPSDLLVWHAKRHLRATLGSVLEQFALIIPQSDVDVGRFRIFAATMKQMPGWCNELKYAALMGNSVWHLWKPPDMALLQLKGALAGRPTWLAANTVHGEEELVGRLHLQIAPQLHAARQPGLVTVVVPQDSGRCAEVAALYAGELGLRVALWSMQDTNAYADMDILLVDDARQLPMFYRLCEVTLMGNSLLEGCTGHSLAQAAVAGTAVLLGSYAGSSEHMAEELNNAAVMAAEDAAAAVRSTGQVMDDGGWDEPPASPARSPTHTATSATDMGTDDRNHSSTTFGNSMRMESRLSQRHSGTSTFGGRPSTAPPTTTRPLLSSQFSQMGQFMPDSPRTPMSEADSLCSETSPHQAVRHFFGSANSGTLSVQMTMGASPRASPRAMAMTAYLRESPRTGGAMNVFGTSLATRGAVAHTTTEWLSPRPSQQQPQAGAALLHPRPSSTAGSLPGSPMAGRGTQDLAGSSRRWERMFSAAEDVVPWSGGAAPVSRSGTPSAAASNTRASSVFSPSPGAAASPRTPSPQAIPASPTRSTTPTGTPRSTASTPTKQLQDSSTQTEHESVVDSEHMAPASLPMVMLAAMVGAIGGVQMVQSPHAATHSPRLAPRPKAPVGSAPPSRRPPETFTPFVHTFQTDDRGEASLSGMPNMPLRTASPITGSPSVSSAGHHPARIATTNGTHVTTHHSRLSTAVSASSPVAGSLCSSPMGTARSSSFVDDPVLEMRAQRLKLRLNHSTWTAASSPDMLSPRLTGTAAPHTSPGPVSASQHSGRSPELMAALEAMVDDDSTLNTAVSNGGSAVHSSMQARKGGHSHSAVSTTDWLTDPWGVGDGEDECRAGPELSSHSAPLLNRSSFEFDLNGSPSFQAQQQRNAENDNALTLHTASSLAAPVVNHARHQPSRLALASGVMPSPFQAQPAECELPSPDSPSPFSAPLQTQDSATREPPAAIWSPTKLPLTMRAPRPSTGLNHHNSANSSRSSAGLYHSDPGSPSCSQPSSSARSERHWGRSDSGSPTNPLRVSVAGWMGDFGHPSIPSAATAAPTLRGTASAAPCTRSSLPGASHQQASSSTVNVPLRTVQEALVLTSSGSSAASANIVGSSTGLSPNTDQDFSLSPRSSAAASPAAGQPIYTVSAAVAIGKATITGITGSCSPSGSLSSMGRTGSLRNVRTPRAVEAEPARAWSASTLPPVSPRASVAPPMSPRASVAPPMSPRASMVPPLSPRASGMPPMSPRASVMPPASPRAPGGEQMQPFSSITIAELQALAANHQPDMDEESAPPETPTSRMSVLNGATSPFASTTFDRPNPFANGHGLPSRLDSATADALSDTLMASLAQAQGEWTRSADESSPPATPTSRLSAMNSVTSPFATSTFDRPNPFAPDAPGSEARAGSPPGVAAAGVSEWQRLQPQLERSDSGSSSGKTTPPRRSPSWVIQQRAAIDLVHGASGDLGQQSSRSHMTAFSSGRPSIGSLAPLPECSTVFLTAVLGSDSGASTPPSNASSTTAAAAFAHALDNHESPGQSGPQGRALSRFFSQSARKREVEQVAGEESPLASHMSAGQATSVEESEPETPRFRPRNSQDFRTRNSFDTQASSCSSNWYHSTPQLQFTEQLLDAPHSTTAVTVAEGSPGSPIGQRKSTAMDASTAALPLPSPCKASTPPSGSRAARRAAYQVRDAAAECCAGFEPGSAAALSILSTANATVQAMTSLGADTEPAAHVGSLGLEAAAPLSPRSPFRQLFDDNGHPTPTHTFAPDPLPAISSEQPDSSSADSLGTDLLNCLASILGEGELGSGVGYRADELGRADAEPSRSASGGIGHMTTEERAMLLATTERLVTALEATLDQGSPSDSPAFLGPPGTLQVQAALQELLAVLGPCTAGVLHGSSSSGNLSASSSSGQFEHLFEHLSSDLRVTSASFAAMPEYSLGIQSMSMAAAMDAAVIMAGFAGVVGASQAGEEDGFAWERVKLRVSTVNVGASASCNGNDAVFLQPMLAAAAADSMNGAVGSSGSGGGCAEEVCGEVTGRCDVPPDTTPLVVPGVNGPVLVAAPLALVSRLSQSHAPSISLAAPIMMPKDLMADILLAMPSLPQLRLPQCQGSGGGGGSATARAGESGASTALYPLAPSTAPAHAAYGRMPTLGDDMFPSTGSSQRSHSSDLYPANAAHGLNAALEAAAMQRTTGVTGSNNSLASLFAFAAPVAAPQPSNTSSAAGTPDAAHPAPAATLSPGLHVRTLAVGTGAPIHGLALPPHQPAPMQVQSLAPVVMVSPTGLGWQPAVQDSSWPAGVTVLLPEESADKAVRSRANTATLTHARAQPTPAPVPGNAPSAYSAINPGVAVAHKVAGASSTATSSNGASNDPRTGRTTQQQQQQAPQQQETSSGGSLGHRAAINTSQPSASSRDNRSVQQQQEQPAHTWPSSGQHFVLPATQLSRSTGPAVWHMANNGELAGALLSLLSDPLERRSRGHAAAQAAAKLASGLVNTVWHVLDDSVITPALHGYVQTQPGSAAAVGTHRT